MHLTYFGNFNIFVSTAFNAFHKLLNQNRCLYLQHFARDGNCESSKERILNKIVLNLENNNNCKIIELLKSYLMQIKLI